MTRHISESRTYVTSVTVSLHVFDDGTVEYELDLSDVGIQDQGLEPLEEDVSPAVVDADTVTVDTEIRREGVYRYVCHHHHHR